MNSNVEKRLVLNKLQSWMSLMRIDKPIGSLLLLWPTLWALWISNQAIPSLRVLVVFVLGVFFIRSAGCVINDFADRKIDIYIKRTKTRPIANGTISKKEAQILFVLLITLGFLLVLTTNVLTVWLSFIALILILIYPFMKRYTHFPQVILGIAFSWTIPMSWTAISNNVPLEGWILFFANVCWTVSYDTQYAMADRDDDLKIGVKSTAILFGRYDRVIIGLLQLSMLILLVLVGSYMKFRSVFYCSLLSAMFFFIYQQKLIFDRNRERCFQAFLNNNYVGLSIFIGILLTFPPFSNGNY